MAHTTTSRTHSRARGEASKSTAACSPFRFATIRRSHENDAVARNGSQILTLARSLSRYVVMLMVSLSVRGPGYIGYLEGCFRAMNPASGALKLLLSSGTEDYFLGTFYFNKGAYVNPLAGVTMLNRTGGHGGRPCFGLDPNAGATRVLRLCTVAGGRAERPPQRIIECAHLPSAADFAGYRVHTDEPLVFERGVELTWRNGDSAGCDLSKVGGNPEETLHASSIALYYEVA